LRDVEARAYRIALVQIRDRHEALDIVQDAMIRLVRRYATRPSEEWPPLFYRILQNRIRDVQRRRAVRTRFVSFFGGTASEEEHDPIAEAPGPRGENPLEQVTADDAMRALEARCNVPEVRSFVLAILQADTFGVSIGRVLRAQADEMRVKRRQMAQERAQKAPVKMLIPMVFCIFPALFVIVLGPAVINIYKQF
jgi:DNA-directed RNA polymerase specialized sigma24 family protein